MTALLTPASMDHRASYVEALREGFRRGDQPAMSPSEIHDVDADFESFLAELTRQTGQIRLPTGQVLQRVPEDTMWLMEGETFIGETKIRHRLNDWLIQVGGHIGYGVRPSFQRQGYGKLILKLALEQARARGVERVLVTCYDHNIASAKVIEANGGVLENIIDDPRGGGQSRRYWLGEPPRA